MSARGITESVIEEAALNWLEGLGYQIASGPNIAPGELFAERDSYDEVVLAKRLREAVGRLNPLLPQEAQEDAFHKVSLVGEPSLVRTNRAFHKLLTDGVDVEYQGEEGRTIDDKARLFDFDELENNDWLAVNQFTVTEGNHNRRPDIVIFVNGLPLGVIELKSAADEDATIWTAFGQLQTYKNEIPALFAFNEVLIVSDGLQARVGSLTADKERFMPWRTVEGKETAAPSITELQVLLSGLFDKRRFLEYVNNFVVFEEENGKLIKKIAGYHQYHTVLKAIETTIEASKPDGDRRCGVVWHTQGSGKSLTMTFFARKAILHPAMENPTIVVLTDRNDLDDQLFGTFCRCSDLLRQTPVQATSRAELRELLKVASGGIFFTTIQKFMPEVRGDTFPTLSERRNIVVIADEAHRSQYDFIDGFARHMRDALPNASFIGFTGTPLDLTDRSTRAVFGEYISIYDIQQAVQDNATVPIYYEGRLAKIELKEEERPHIDPDFEEATEGEEVEKKEKIKSKWARLEAMVGTEKRIGLVAEDLVEHFEKRLDVIEGKALVVCMSRRICVDLYDAIVKLRPNWHHDQDMRGMLKVVMTGSASETEWQMHIRSKARREEIAKRFKDPADPLRMVIVRDMWLTGFDVPCLHTMYVDKPMRGHGLMQAIARVNRVFRDKPGGLVVDYLGLAAELQKAMANYTQSGGKGETAINQEQAVAVMLEKYEICRGLFHGFDYSLFITGKPQEKLSVLPRAQQHILSIGNGADRLITAVNGLSKSFALAVPHDEALRIQDDVGFFQTVRSAIRKTTGGGGGAKDDEDIELAIKQIVSRAVASDKVLDLFSAAGLKKPNISILSEEFLAEVKSIRGRGGDPGAYRPGAGYARGTPPG
jgi:type I restriction enzyme R subunit